MPGHPFEHGFDLRLVPDKLAEPFRWASPRTVFVNSMSDLFHESVPDDYIESVARVMMEADWHTYQVLTKRATRMRELLNGRLRFVEDAAHIWWGVSVENKKHGLPRVAELVACEVPVRFLSVEPLLEDLGVFELNGIHWVIVGGESGPGARPLRAAWVQNIRLLCADADVPFFFKQWGGVQKCRFGRELDGNTYDAMPPRSEVAQPPRRERLERAARVGGPPFHAPSLACT